MITAMKRAMAINSDTKSNGYRWPSSSAEAAAAVGKDDKGSGSLF
jgi:hypothetical protein